MERGSGARPSCSLARMTPRDTAHPVAAKGEMTLARYHPERPFLTVSQSVPVRVPAPEQASVRIHVDVVVECPLLRNGSHPLGGGEGEGEPSC